MRTAPGRCSATTRRRATWQMTFLHASLGLPPAQFVGVPGDSPFFSLGNGVELAQAAQEAEAAAAAVAAAGGGGGGGRRRPATAVAAGGHAAGSVRPPRPALPRPGGLSRARRRSSGERAADLGRYPAALGPPGHPRRDRLHDLPHGGHARRPGLRDHLGDDRRQLSVAELSGQVPGQHLVLGPLRGGLLRPPGRLERVGRLAAPPGLPRPARLSTSSSLRSARSLPATSSLVIEVRTIRSVLVRTSSRAFIAVVRSLRSRSFSSAMEHIHRAPRRPGRRAGRAVALNRPRVPGMAP